MNKKNSVFLTLFVLIAGFSIFSLMIGFFVKNNALMGFNNFDFIIIGYLVGMLGMISLILLISNKND